MTATSCLSMASVSGLLECDLTDAAAATNLVDRKRSRSYH